VSRGRLPAIVLEWTWFASAAMGRRSEEQFVWCEWADGGGCLGVGLLTLGQLIYFCDFTARAAPFFFRKEVLC
jgi:hypothetical protein